MAALSYFFIFILGLLIGSFLNCVIYRLEKKESFLKGRSYCPACRHQLSWRDLVPVISFLILQGRCRYCRQKISWQYPLVEISTALLFLAFLNNLLLLIISCFLIIIFVYDLKHYLIPDKVIYPAIILALIFNFKFLIFAGLAAGFFLAIVLISRGRWMGVGDIKLAFLMGLVLGWPSILVASFSAFFLGAVIGVGLIAAGRKKMRSEVPFGPFLAAGTFLAIFFGRPLVDWYLSFFLL